MVLPLVGQDEIHVPEHECRECRLRLGFHQLAAKVGCLSGERPHRRHRQTQRGGLEARDPAPPRDSPRGRGQVGLRELCPLEQLTRVTHQHERGVGEPHPSPRRFQQRQARLALKHGELLGHGRGREPQRVGHGGDRASRVELVEEPEAVEVQHSQQC